MNPSGSDRMGNPQADSFARNYHAAYTNLPGGWSRG